MCNRKLAAEPAVPQYALVEKECLGEVPLFGPCFLVHVTVEAVVGRAFGDWLTYRHM